MRNFCIVEKDSRANHAGSKARNDTGKIMVNHGYLPLYVHHSEQKGIIDKLYMSLMTILDWYKIKKKMKSGDKLLIQYPLAMYPRVSGLAVPLVRQIKKNKTKIILLIHDLESLRGLSFKSEKKFLELADVVIVHNEVMKNYLLDKGYQFDHIFILGFFDYLIPGYTPVEKRNNCEVAIAGNLKSDKSGYIKYLHELEGNIQYHLYGPGFQGEKKTERVIYKGEYTPEKLPYVMTEGWGLVWDGDSIHECHGNFGTYLKYNNPHKVSLYLAVGMPVIVWKQSAVASWVKEKNVGIVINDLEEISFRLEKITNEKYKEILENVQKIGAELRKGASLEKVIKNI